mgnify:CR=1 FL=1
MKIKEIAKLLGTTESTIRCGLQQGVFDFGVAFKRTPESRHYTYVIFPEKVKEYVKGETV